MIRRRFLGLALAALALPAAGEARAKRIGILTPTPAESVPSEYVAPLYAALRPLGLVQGRDVDIAWRSAGLDDRKLAGLARELVAGGVDVLSVDGSPATHAARAATTTIPIVTGLADPVRSGFAKTIARPGGNVTGLSIASFDSNRRLVELLRQLSPRLAEVFIFHRPTMSPETIAIMVDAVRDAGIGARTVPVSSLLDVTGAFEAMQKRGDCAALVPSHLGPVDFAHLIELGLRLRIPVGSHYRDLTAEGALLSFELVHRDNIGRRAWVIAEILRGANPADIPFQLPDSYELALNRTTARRLGLEVPAAVLLRATEVLD